MSTPGEGRQWSALLSTLIAGGSLGADDTAWAMDQVMAGEATSVQIAGFAVALRGKGETVDEVSGLARAMLEHATLVDVTGPVTDLVGTGGDRAHTVNISTMSTVVAAATGVRMVKHGNRAASSSCGSADLLEKLGIAIELSPASASVLAEDVGITFCFAPLFHPGFRHAAVARRELGVPTVFNFLGPLTNPARATATAVGVSDRRMCPLVAGVLAERHTSALVFRGADGLDELTTTAPSSVWIVDSGRVAETTFDPEDLDIPRAEPEALRGGDVEYNAEVARSVLAGHTGPVRDAVVLNAAAALVARRGLDDPYAHGRADPGEWLRESMRRALGMCAEAVDSGAAAALLERWSEASRKLATRGT